MNNLLEKLTPPEPLGQCDSNFIGMFQTVRFIQMMSLTFGLFTQMSGSGPLGPLVFAYICLRILACNLQTANALVSRNMYHNDMPV